MQCGIVDHPIQEASPRGIEDGLGKSVILDHIADLQVFIGKEVARRHERVCLFSGKILTLPVYFQMRLGQLLSGLAAIVRAFLLAGYLSLQGLELLFRFPQEARVLNRSSFGVSVEFFQPHVNPTLHSCCFMSDGAFRLNDKLDKVAIGPLENPDPLDLCQ